MDVWHEKFLASLGNNWGSFISLDDSTLHKKRFDIARLLVSVESRLRIPSSMNVKVREKFQNFDISGGS